VNGSGDLNDWAENKTQKKPLSFYSAVDDLGL
jgi:hypothetical protein